MRKLLEAELWLESGTGADHKERLLSPRVGTRKLRWPDELGVSSRTSDSNRTGSAKKTSRRAADRERARGEVRREGAEKGTETGARSRGEARSWAVEHRVSVGQRLILANPSVPLLSSPSRRVGSTRPSLALQRLCVPRQKCSILSVFMRAKSALFGHTGQPQCTPPKVRD